MMSRSRRDSYEHLCAIGRTVDVLKEIQDERKNQDARYGVNRVLPNGDWALLTQEELGEAAQDILAGEYNKARAELVQAAALIVAWIESLDNEAAEDGRPITYGKAL